MEHQKDPEKCGLLGKLSPGEKKLDGKTFYFDRVKKRSAALLLEVITLFGGKVESFLHNEVSFLVTGYLEALAEHKALDSSAKGKIENEETTPSKQQGRGQGHDRQKQGTSRPAVNVCGSRGKTLLEKAILNKERLQGTSVLSNARSWGVKILYADDVLSYLRQLSQESFDTKSKKSEKVYSKQGSNAVKAAPLRSPYIKIEDSSRKYKPLHMQSMSFPSLYYSGRYSPFECPPPPRFDKWTEPEKKNKENKVAVSTEDKFETPHSWNPSPWKPRQKDAYCECCRQTYNNQEEHLQSDQHRAFVLEASNYSVVDQLIAAMTPVFILDLPPHSEELKGEALTMMDACELEPLTDIETEITVKALQTQESNFRPDIPVLKRDTFLPSTDNPPPEIPKPSTIQNVDFAALPLSPLMPVLEMMPQEPLLFEPHQDLKPLSPCPISICQNSDPFPPVLSPQVPDLYTHSSYSEAPVLSPQPFSPQEPKDELRVQIENQSSVSQCFPVDLHHSRSVAKSPEKMPAEMEVCFNSWDRRSRSLPRQSAAAIKSKKRSRSASPESSLRKRRRIDEKGGDETKHEQKSEMTKDTDSLLLEQVSYKNINSSPKQGRTLQTFGIFGVPQASMAAQGLPNVKRPFTNAPLTIPKDKYQTMCSSRNSEHSNSHSTSVCIESALIPDVAALSSSDSDWDCELLSCLSAPRRTIPTPNEPNCELDKELLQQSCPWMHNSSYETRLHSALKPTTQTMTVDAPAFSRTVVQIVEVQH